MGKQLTGARLGILGMGRMGRKRTRPETTQAQTRKIKMGSLSDLPACSGRSCRPLLSEQRKGPSTHEGLFKLVRLRRKPTGQVKTLDPRHQLQRHDNGSGCRLELVRHFEEPGISYRTDPRRRQSLRNRRSQFIGTDLSSNPQGKTMKKILLTCHKAFNH